mmetsp:Transcript_6561/g.7548  ORF Transcript_6561/g.7548 Transcript_6561/m.7548 type:complete len:106 (-) Transcript_6561:28-345(-)
MDLQSLITSDSVVVFTLQGCKACKQAVKEIKQEDIHCKVVDCSGKKYGEQIREALSEATGQTNFPSVWIGGKYVGSLEEGPESWMGVVPMINSGKFQQLVASTRR